MTEWRIVDEEFVGYYSGYAYLVSNDECKFHVWERKEDAEKVCTMLNNLHNEVDELETENEKLENRLWNCQNFR